MALYLLISNTNGRKGTLLPAYYYLGTVDSVFFILHIILLSMLLECLGFLETGTVAVPVVDKVTSCDPGVGLIVSCLFRNGALSSMISPVWCVPFVRPHPWILV